MGMDVKLTYCDDLLPIYTNLESLCYTPEINIMC